MYSYPVELAPDDGGFVVTFPDLPYGVTEGEDREEALARAAAAIETVLTGLMADRQPIPAPSVARGRPLVTITSLSAVKVALYEAMRQAGVRKTALARRLGWHLPQVDRLLDLRHASRLEQIETALRVLGKEIVIEVRDAA